MSLTLKDMEAFLGAPAADADLQPYMDAASVLAAFDPVSLRPLGGTQGKGDALVERLLPLCEPITEGSERGLWSLSLADRRACLRRLRTRERMTEALAANPRRAQTPTQRIFERVLAGESIALDGLLRDELAGTIEVGEWLRGLLDGVPAEASVRHALARHDLVAPMRRLMGGGFVNREAELERLRAYVGGQPPAAPLFVCGPGGVGKSTLLAKFLLNELERRDRAVAYLDIDRPTIMPEQPMTLLAEAVPQLAMQLALPERAAGLIELISESLGRREETRHVESDVSIVPNDWVFEQFAELLAEAPGDRVVIVVVDTFEEAQFLGTDVAWPLVEFLMRLTHAAPTVRVVMSGRVLPEEYAALTSLPPIDLGVLDQLSARELLARSVEHAGLAKLSQRELDDVIGVVSRNPMCLKLAVRLLRDEGVSKLRSMRSEVLARLKAEKVQALLYGRILHHIHTQDVKMIAYPGLIVRRITADVIRDVLAKPCGIELKPDRNESAILWDLQREAALVEVDPEDGSLRHRADVRRAMIEDLRDHVEPDVVAAIDAAAVEFYARQDGPIARAEEIYHRLRRGDSAAEIDKRWLPSAGVRLKNAGDELPPQQRLWLAEKLGVTLDASVREAASQEAWEAQASRSADRYLLSRRADEALDVLHEREERLPRSELFSLEAEAYRFLGRHDDALRVARAGVESTAGAGAIDVALELLLKMVVIEEGRSCHDAAEALVEEAAAVATHSSNALLRLRTVVTELRVHRRRHPDLHDARATKRAEALALLTPDVIYQLRSRSVLLREVAAELAKEDPRVASVAFETLGIELASDEQAELLGRALLGLQREAAVTGDLSPQLTEAVVSFEDSGFDPEILKEWSMQRTSGRDTREISKAVAVRAPGDEVLQDFRDYYRAGVDHSIGLS